MNLWVRRRWFGQSAASVSRNTAGLHSSPFHSQYAPGSGAFLRRPTGYVATLTGRSRSTEDIDIILETLSESETEQLVTELKDRGYWGMTMPLDETYPMVSEGSRIRTAEEGKDVSERRDVVRFERRRA